MGRQKQISDAVRFAETCEISGSTGIIRIWAPPGLGKTRLVTEMERSMPSRRFLLMKGDPSPGSPVFGNFVREWFGLDPRRDIRWNIGQFQRVWEGLVIDTSARHLDLDARRPFLEHLAGLPAGGDIEGIEPEERWERTAAALTRFLDLLASRSGTAIVMEDLHWFSSDELTMASRLIEGGTADPRLFIVTGRPDSAGEPPALADPSPILSTLDILLEGLPRESLEGFIRENWTFLPSEELLDYLWTVAGGVPLFLGLTMDYLLESGALEVTGGSAGLSTDPGSLPVSAVEIFSSRLELMDSSERALVAAASVLGPSFSVTELGSMVHPMQLDPASLRDSLDWVLDFEGDRAAFRHDLVRDWILEKVPVEEIPGLHLRAAEVLSGRTGDLDSPAFAELMASHYRMGGDEERTAEYLDMASRGYALDFRNDLAARLYRELLPLLEDPDRMERELDLYDVYKNSGLLREATALLGNTLERTTSTVIPPGLRARVQLKLGESLGSSGELARAEELVRESLEVFASQDDTGSMARAYRQLGMILMAAGRIEEALQATDTSIELARRTGDSRLICAALYWAAINWRQVGDHERMEACTLEQVELAEKSGLTKSIIAGYDNLMRVHIYRRDYDAAEEVHGRLREAAGRTANWAALNTATSKMGIIHLRRGEMDKAAECFRTCISLSDRTGNMRARCAALGNLAHTAIESKDTASALDYSTELIDLAGRTGFRSGLMAGYARMGYVLTMMGDYHSALECLQTQIEHARELKDSRNLSDAWAKIADIQFMLGDTEGSMTSIDRALEYSSEAGDMLLRGSQLAQKGRYLFLKGDGKAAREFLEESLEQNTDRKGREHVVFRCRLYLDTMDGNDLGHMLRDGLDPEVEAEVHFCRWLMTGDTEAARMSRRLLESADVPSAHPVLNALPLLPDM